MKRALFSVPLLCLPAFLLCALCVSSSLPSAISLFPSPSDPVARPKICSLAFVRLKSTDFGKAKAFYEQILGLRSESAECRGSSGLCYRVNEFQHVELVETGSRDRSSFLETIGLRVSDVEQMQKFLSSHGVATSAISVGPNNLRSLQISDPEGHQIMFIERSFISGGPDQIDGPRQISNRLLHAGFVVKDLDRMKKFYVDLLGFRLYWHGSFPSAERPGSATEADDWYEIQVPDGDNWLEFMLNISPAADHQELGVQNHFSLGVTSANASASKLRENGATKFDGPEVGRDGKNSLDIYDPDLSRVEVMDFAPTKSPCCHPYTADHPKP